MLRILYVEDDPTAREYIQKGLAERGYHVEVAHDADEGVAMATRGPFDLLLLDVMLPDSDGFEILQSLRDRSIDIPALDVPVRGVGGLAPTGRHGRPGRLPPSRRTPGPPTAPAARPPGP